jgi:hypothetical protein
VLNNKEINVRTQQNKIWLRIGFSIAAIIAVGAAKPVLANASPSPFSIEASLVTPAQISLGEPILVHYDVVNMSGQTAAVRMGLYGTDWYTLSLRDANGLDVQSIPDRRPKQPMGAFSTQDAFLHNGDDSSGYISVSKYEIIQHPGRYTLTIHINIPYTLTGDSEPGFPGATASVSGLAVSQDITLTILVTPPDAARLHATAEAIEKSVSNPIIDSRLARAEMDGLFSMPETQVSDIWKELTLKPGFNSDWAASELEDLHTKTGVDILIQMLDAPRQLVADPSNRLNELYNTADPALKEYIKQVAAKHGIIMPNVAPTAVRLD